MKPDWVGRVLQTHGPVSGREPLHAVPEVGLARSVSTGNVYGEAMMDAAEHLSFERLSSQGSQHHSHNNLQSLESRASLVRSLLPSSLLSLC